MRGWLVLPLAVAVWAGCGCGGAGRVSARAVAGDYEWTHPVLEPTGEELDRWVSAEVTDTLRITPGPAGAIRFAFFIQADNGHSCEMEGVALPAGRGFEYREVARHGDAPPDTCVLRLWPEDGRVRLEDVGGGCRRENCGVRGRIDGATFVRLRHRLPAAWTLGPGRGGSPGLARATVPRRDARSSGATATRQAPAGQLRRGPRTVKSGRANADNLHVFQHGFILAHTVLAAVRPLC